MKLTIMFIIAGIIQVAAINSYSQTTRLTFELKSASVSDVLKEIENQSEFYFAYNKDAINLDRIVDLTVKNLQVEEILDQLFRETNVKYKITDRHIILSTLELVEPQKSVSGKVTDTSGGSLPGVSVVVKGTTIGVITDMDGKYSLSKFPENSTLVFSFVGMKTQEIGIGDKTTINVTLVDETIGIEEVVAVGYGTQSKRTLTGAISNINSETIMRTPSIDASSALVGKIPGITSRSTDARPGRGTIIQIRNFGQPLYVIDGVPYGGTSGTNAYGYTSGSGADVFNNLSVEDIESVTILKDAEAAIYGLRAANGVILVTTKSGKDSDSPKVNVNGYYGLQNFTRFPHPSNSKQYVTSLLWSAQNLKTDPSLTYTPEEYAKWMAGTEKGYQGYDYYDIILRKNVPQYYLNANISGGSKKSKYYTSISDVSQNAMIDEFKYRRTNIQTNVEVTVIQGLKLGAKMNAQITKQHNVATPNNDNYWAEFYSLMNMWPIESPYANDNPLYINQTHNAVLNPASFKEDVSGYVDENWNTFNANIYGQYDFKFGLQAKITASYNYMNEDYDSFSYSWPAYKYNTNADTYETNASYGNVTPSRERHKRNVVSRYLQGQLNYSKTFGGHSIKALLGYERSDYENVFLTIHTIPSNNYIDLMAFSQQDKLGDSWAIEAREGFIGKINYNFLQKYLVEAIARYDGSFLYAPENRWGFFPSVSAGWMISEESFFKNSLSNIIKDLKIRASYGSTGSEMGVNPFGYLSGYNTDLSTTGTGSSVLDGTYVIGVQPKGLPVTNLSWVTNNTMNIGIDFALLKDRNLTGQFDIFERVRKGLPAARYDVLLPSEVGYTLPNENLNSDSHRGIDGLINYNGKSGSFDYSIGINGTFARQRVLHTYKPRFGNSWDQYRNSVEDRWSSVNWGYKVIGQFQSIDQIEHYTINNDGQGNRSQLPGDLIFADVNGDNIINTYDQVPIGYAEGALPYASFGINSSISWKGIGLLFDFNGGTCQSFQQRWETQIPYQSNGNSPSYLLSDVWHQADPYDNSSQWIAGRYPAIRKSNTTHVNFNKSDFWVTNVKYLKLKNIELGYDFPKSVLNKIHATKLRVYIHATNPFMIDNMKRLEIDPEIAINSGLYYPQTKLYTIGFNLTL